MNAGILQFSLGLSAGGFLSTIGQAESKVKSFAGSMLKLPGLETAVAGALASFGTAGGLAAGLFSAFEKGAELEHLSRRTGESVKSLFELEQGFAAVGLSAGDVSSAVFQMQRSLGGLNEMGESTIDIFTRMGLSVQQLRKMDAAHQFALIARQLALLGPSDAARAASMIFGREQAGNLLQLARSGGEFGEGMKKAAAQAEIFARNAERFEKIQRSMEGFKSSVNGFFAGLAEGAAPGIQRTLDALNSVDFTRIGQKFGEVLEVMAQSIKDHEFGKLIELSLNSGFEAAGNYAVATVWGIEAAMQKAFDNLTHPQNHEQAKTAGVSWLKAAERAIGGAHSAILGTGDMIVNSLEHTLNAGIRQVVPNSKFQIPEGGSEQKLAERMIEVDKAINELNTDLGVAAPATRNFLRSTMDGTKEAFEQAFKANLAKGSASAATALSAFYARELQRSPKPGAEASSSSKPTGSKSNLAPATESYRPEFTIFEKMGFVMSGLGNPALEHARTTAMNTTRLVQLAEAAAKQEPSYSEAVINQPL